MQRVTGSGRMFLEPKMQRNAQSPPHSPVDDPAPCAEQVFRVRVVEELGCGSLVRFVKGADGCGFPVV